MAGSCVRDGLGECLAVDDCGGLCGVRGVPTRVVVELNEWDGVGVAMGGDLETGVW